MLTVIRVRITSRAPTFTPADSGSADHRRGRAGRGRRVVVRAADRVRGRPRAGHRVLAQPARGGRTEPLRAGSTSRRVPQADSGCGPAGGAVLRSVRGRVGRALRDLGAERPAHLGRHLHRAGRHPAGLAGADRPRPGASAAPAGVDRHRGGGRRRGGRHRGGRGSLRPGRPRRRPGVDRRRVRRRLHRVRGTGADQHQHHHLHHHLLRDLRADPAGPVPGRWRTADRVRRAYLAGHPGPGGRRPTARALDVQLRTARRSRRRR